MSNFVFSSVEGNSQKLDGGAMFGNAPRAMWSKWIAPDELGRIPLACRCFLVEFGDYKILLEAGIGAFFEPKMAERFGVQDFEKHLLIENLKDLGVEASEVTHVILSHLHFDHAGGLLPTYKEINAGHDGLLFENAQYVVGKEAWERAQAPHSRDRASFIPGFCEKLENSGRLFIVDNGNENKLLDGRLSFVESHGHTPGQILAKIQGEKESILFCGDLVPGSHWVHVPITMGYDRFPELVIDEKKALYESLDLETSILFFTHDSEVSAGKIAMNEKKKYFVNKAFEKPIRQSF